MNILREIKDRILILDGGMGTEVMEQTGKQFDIPEQLNLEDPEVIIRIHKAFVDAGADIIETNTLGANRIKLAEYGLEDRCKDINLSALELAKRAASPHSVYIAGSIGSMGELIKPLGEITFQQAYEVFAEQSQWLEQGGADLLLIETQIDILEAKTALLAAQETTSLPIAVSITYPLEENLTVTGTDPETAAITLSSTSADIVGINCGRHPRDFKSALNQYQMHTDKPLIVYANAGIPEKRKNRIRFPLGPVEYLKYAVEFYRSGAHIIGGCCGTSSRHIKLIAEKLKGKKPQKRARIPSYFRSSSRNSCLFIGGSEPFKAVGENINPFSRKELDQEFKSEKLSLARSLARRQEQAGAHALDINLGQSGDQNPDFFSSAVLEIQSVSKLPLFLDNNNPSSLEKALQCYAGKAVINSISGETKKYQKLLPLAKKYGAGVILLAMDDRGIPDNSDQRINIIEHLIQKAYEYGLTKSDILIDPIVLSHASSPKSASETLAALKKIKQMKTPSVLGLSNISHGLPNRRRLNQIFLTMAIDRGLDSAILNPLDKDLMDTTKACDTFKGKDPGLRQFIRTFGNVQEEAEETEQKPAFQSKKDELFNAIVEGEKKDAQKITSHLIEQGENGLELLKKILSPALELVGQYYEQKKYFLPQLILSAEAMEGASQIIEKTFPEKGPVQTKSKIVLATVQGDLHDIGKNIVALVLSNSGFEVIDLGKNVASKEIISTAVNENCEFIGLSALMTSSLEYIEEVIQLKKKKAPEIQIIIGGAAVSSAFSQKCGADAYAGDAMSALRKLKNMV
ncbi:MAG: 5-methyltetrahydrofolate--homocysteine methyltransferase [Candidatus Aminicenantes bacterium]|nr:5-methyltetrahydrofolate--homocysteine methyltransferase [Candidatus Aminicenantes bacterium]